MNLSPILSPVGKYEAEALRRRRDELHRRRASGWLAPHEGAELDRIVEQIGDDKEHDADALASAVEALARGAK